MSPYDLDIARKGKLKEELFTACAKLGWERYEVIIPHEREWNSSSTEHGWRKDGVWLISDDALSEALAEEIIRLAAR